MVKESETEYEDLVNSILEILFNYKVSKSDIEKNVIDSNNKSGKRKCKKTLDIGDRVDIVNGNYSGSRGTVLRFTKCMVYVSIDGHAVGSWRIWKSSCKALKSA